MNLRYLLVAIAFAVLAVVAVLGWTRRTEPVANTVAQPALTPSVQTAYYDAYGQPVNGASPVSAMTEDRVLEERYYPSVHRPVRVVNAPMYSAPVENSADRQAFAPAPSATYEHPHERSGKKSVAIVAGSAAGGAAIGALAGGGKGAGIGALAGGAGGFIYDRLTHNHH